MLGERGSSAACPRGPASTTQTTAAAASQRPAGYRTGDRTATGGCQSPQYVTANKVCRSIPNPTIQVLASQFPSDRECCSIPVCPGQVRHASAILCTLVVTVMRDRGSPVPSGSADVGHPGHRPCSFLGSRAGIQHKSKASHKAELLNPPLHNFSC